MVPTLLYLIIMLVLMPGTESINITKCCQAGVSSVDLQQLSCRPTLTDHQPPYQVNKPKIFSLKSEKYVSQPFQVTSIGIPQCEAGEVLSSILNELFVLIAEQEMLFVMKDSSTYSNFCVDDVQSIGRTVGSIALFCELSDKADSQDTDVLITISNQVTPALLIISEVFLLLTFVLHVIVPDIRKHMFGK